jgi:hypothetical protein
MHNTQLVCFLLALVCFSLSAFNVPKLKWDSAGFAFITLSFLI